MCLHIKYTTKIPVPKILTEDRIVYKRLRRHDSVYHPQKFITPFRGYIMQEGIHYYQIGHKFGYEFNGLYYSSIKQGLHAYTTLSKALSCVLSNEIVVAMTIPAGSEYFEDKYYREICADNLIWHKGAKIYNK